MARVFVVWDSELKAVGQVLAGFERRQRVPGHTVTSLGSRGGSAHGQLDDRIRGQLHDADALLAFLDHPNANMAWELGLGLGLGKAVQMAREGSGPPVWVRDTPLASMLYTERAASLSGMTALLATEGAWPRLSKRPEGGDRTLLLCPNADDGEMCRDDIEHDLPDVFEAPIELSAWRLLDLPRQLEGVGRAAWILPVGAHDQPRHGVETTVYALIAGYLEALNVPLGVFCCAQGKLFADLGGRSQTYLHGGDLVAKLRTWAEKTPVVGSKAARARPDHTLAAWRDLARASHARRIPLLRDADEVALDTVYVRLAVRSARGLHDGGGPRAGAAEGADLGAAPLEAVVRRHLTAEPRAATAGRWVVSGEPGAGKTTLARHLVWRLADDADAVPVFLRLADLPVDTNPLDRADADYASQRLGASAGQLRSALDRAARAWGRLWLVLDGLDEVSQEDRPARLHRLAAWARDPDYAGVVIVVLAREQAADELRGLGAGYLPLAVEPLTLAQQGELVDNLVRAEVVGEAAGAAVRDALRRGHLPPDLVRNPLMLSLVALTAQGRAAGPRVHRRSVLQDAVELLLTRRHAFRDAPTERSGGVRDAGLVRRLLRRVALDWHTQGGERWEEEAVLGLLRSAVAALPEADQPTAYRLWPRGAADLLEELDRHGGVVGRFDGPRSGYGWLHRSFRELLAAEEVAGWEPAARAAWLAERTRLPDEVGALDAWDATRREREEELFGPWSEVLGLLVGLVPGEALPLLEGLVGACPAAAVRALIAAEDLAPWTHLDLLTCCESDGYPAWNNEHLDRVVEALRRRDDSAAALWARVVPGAPTAELGLVAYALERLGHLPDREAFFAAAGRPVEGAPTLPTVSLHDPVRRTFRMGSPDGVGDDDEHPGHTVTLTAPFSLGVTPVTVAQYRAFDPAHTCPGGDEHPVTEVDWFSARLFAWWVGGRLPTEAEWECACRAGTTTKFSFGDDAARLGEFGWFEGNSDTHTHPVGQKRANPWGLHDLHGNVWEWAECRWLREYGDDATDPVGPDAHRNGGRVVRGGSAWDGPERCRSGYRVWFRLGVRSDGLGFRVALP